jgi:hypothetical protein
MKIPLVGADLFRADGQTDMKKLILAFRNFANAPKYSQELRRFADTPDLNEFPDILTQEVRFREL